MASTCRRYAASGVAQGGEFRVNLYATGDQRYPSVAVDFDGDAVIAWESLRDSVGSGFGVFARQFPPGICGGTAVTESRIPVRTVPQRLRFVFDQSRAKRGCG